MQSLSLKWTDGRTEGGPFSMETTLEKIKIGVGEREGERGFIQI